MSDYDCTMFILIVMHHSLVLLSLLLTIFIACQANWWWSLPFRVLPLTVDQLRALKLNGHGGCGRPIPVTWYNSAPQQTMSVVTVSWRQVKALLTAGKKAENGEVSEIDPETLMRQLRILLSFQYWSSSRMQEGTRMCFINNNYCVLEVFLCSSYCLPFVV